MYKLELLKKPEATKVYLYEDDELVEMYEEEEDKPRLEGNIYLGYVKELFPGMQAAFIDIGEPKAALIHIRDLLPKVSTVTGNLNINPEDYNLTDFIKKNEKILVQVKRDCNNEKGPRVTTDIKLTGNYVVLLPNSKFVTCSQKIAEPKKKELEELIKKYIPEGMGAIARTASEKAEESKIEKDIEYLLDLWEQVNKKAKEAKNSEDRGTLIYNNLGIIGKIIVDIEPLGLEVFTNSKDLKEFVESISDKVKVTIVKEIEEHERPNRKVWLKCGGFITIDETEALVAIDVNSGKYIGKDDVEDMIVKVNMEATEEIAKQLRLRDIGGIIIIDYIDMEDKKDNQKIIDYMQEKIAKDRTKVQITEFSKLGLLEMTRKHMSRRMDK